MTTQSGQPFNVAQKGANVGIQGQRVDIDSATFTGDVQLTIAPGDPPRVKLQVGIDNLKHDNPREARKLLWDVMLSNYGGNETLFYWLVAMLSGRTVQQFSNEERGQLKRWRPQGGEAALDR